MTLARTVKTLRWYFLFGIVLGFVVILGILYHTGFRPGPHLSLVRTGSVVLEGIPPGTTVYVDQRLRGSSHEKEMTLHLVPGTHGVIVDAYGSQQWTGTVNVAARDRVIVRPLLVPLEVSKAPLDAAEASRAADALARYALPNDTDPLLLRDGCLQVAVTYDRVIATGTSTPECSPPPYLCHEGVCDTDAVFVGSGIRSVVPYPGRSDALVVSYDDSVTVVELGPDHQQFPLLSGTEGTVLPWNDSEVVLVDATGAYGLSLGD